MTELWFEAAASYGRPVSRRVSIPAPDRGNPTSPPFIPTRPVDPVTQTVICNKCEGGYGVGNMFPGTVCPEGWTLDKDPCKTQVVKGPPVLLDDDPIRIDPVNADENIEFPVLEEITPVFAPVPEPNPVTPTPDPVDEKKDNNDLILYIAIGVGAYLLLKK
jgi:hypothetical protein